MSGGIPGAGPMPSTCPTLRTASWRVPEILRGGDAAVEYSRGVKIWRRRLPGAGYRCADPHDALSLQRVR